MSATASPPGESARPDEDPVWGEIDGTTITLPMVVADFDAATLLFGVPLEAAAALIPGDAFAVADVGGRAQFVLALCDYHDNPWGDYLEINLGFLARPRSASDEVLGSFVYRMPVDQEFTCQAGNRVMGFPKSVEDLSRTDGPDGRVTFAMHRHGDLVLAVSLPKPVDAGEPVTVDSVSYSYLDGKPYETPLSLQLGTGIVDPTEVTVELGTGPIADELRTLELERADMVTWGTGLSGTFWSPRSLADR